MSAEKHAGGCQCGKVRYEVDIDLAKPVTSCNCSMCGRSGTLLSFVPDVLTDYQFNKHVIHHLFCRICGIKSFARGTDRTGGATVAVNTRCLDGVDIARLNMTAFDGKSR